MNRLEIECFLLTVSLKSYTKAAKKLFLSQPTVSRYVAKLEKELNCQLLKRTTQKIELTEAGQQYYRLFLSWEMELTDVKKRIHYIQDTEQCCIRLGYQDGWVLPDSVHRFFSEFENKYPQIEIDLHCMGLESLLSQLSRDRLDMILIMEHPGLENPLFYKKEITTTNKVICYSKYHPLAQNNMVNVRDFKDETFFVLDENVDFVIQKNRDYCKEYQFIPRIKKAENIQTILANVLAGKGVTITDDWGPGCYEEYYRNCPLTAKGIVYLTWKNTNSKQAYETFAREFVL